MLIGLVAPYPGRQEGRSLFEVARDSSWRNLGDWPAAWCSIKLILLALGIRRASLIAWRG